MSREYLAYLDGLHISWIACGRERIDFVRACAIPADEFGVTPLKLVGVKAFESGAVWLRYDVKHL